MNRGIYINYGDRFIYEKKKINNILWSDYGLT